MQIRGATIEDCPGLAKLQAEGGSSAHAGSLFPDGVEGLGAAELESRWHAWMDEHPEDVLYVAEADKGGIIGYAVARAGQSEVAGVDGELLDLYVRERNRRMGIGRLLLWTVARELRSAGSRAMMVWSVEADPVCAVCERLGAIRLEASRGIAGRPGEVAYGWPEIERVWKGAPRAA